MLNKLIDLFERLVVAQEVQAEAAKAMSHAPNTAPGPLNADQHVLPGTVEQTKPSPAPEQDVKKETEQEAGPAWNPLAEKPMTRYTKDKQEIMDAMLAERGIDASAMRTGAEKHAALLDYEAGGKVAPAGAGAAEEGTAPSQAAAPAADTSPAPKDDAAEPVTLAECQQLAAHYSTQGAKVPDIVAVIKGANGGKKLVETPEKLLPAVKAALMAAFEPKDAPTDEGW